MGSASAVDTIRNISTWNLGVKPTTTSRSKASEEYGSLTFNDEAQRARLPKDVYRALRRAVAHLLHQRQAHQRLHARQVNAALLAAVFVVKGVGVIDAWVVWGNGGHAEAG